MALLEISLFCLFSVLVSVKGDLPSYISPCKVHSPDFRECAIKSGNAAVPSLANGDKKFGIPSFNPLLVPFIEFSSGDFKLNGTDTIVSGLPNIRMNDMRVDVDKKTIMLNVSCPEISLDINYNIGGKIASIPIEGHGKGKIAIYDVVIIYDFTYGEQEQKGKKHLFIKTDNLELQPQKMTIQLDNLFNGNKPLGESTNKFLNENWQEALKEFKPALNEIVGSIVKGIIKPIAKKVPLTELFSDY